MKRGDSMNGRNGRTRAVLLGVGIGLILSLLLGSWIVRLLLGIGFAALGIFLCGC